MSIFTLCLRLLHEENSTQNINLIDETSHGLSITLNPFIYSIRDS
jgi:hypothetical protein